ncbi:LacI family DNA-binding transcriptional regulator [Paenibacillus cellulositrophicus]|uniref:LacI family DNA-binding transcriptional regulator n=1 Tax=Paenibacillus cellulositrophicus TaxID=562959 RepID=UPI0012673D1A|nr:LacI family DNA-binding transcriptional regulator [Paenibacillus cellulositrophicus]
MVNVTIADVAAKAGVSLATVSRVLNNRDGSIKISEKTKQKVLQSAQELGYQINPFAAALRSKRSGVIGAIIRDIHDPFLSLLVREVQKAAHDKGMEMLMGHADYDAHTAERQLHFMINHWFDGLVLIGNLSTHSLLERSKQSGTPIVSITGDRSLPIPQVRTDDAKGVHLALDHLIELGHHTIGFLGNLEHAGVRTRLRAFKDYLQHRGFEPDESHILDARDRFTAFERSKAFFECRKAPSALFCTSDQYALSAIRAAWYLNKRIPDDLSIIGFDDIEEAADSFPPLTTVKQPARELAITAINLLTGLIDGTRDTIEQSESVVEPQLIIRETTATRV